MIPSRCQRLSVFLFSAAIVASSASAQKVSAAQSGISLEAVTGFQARPDGIDIQAGPASLRITGA